MSLPGGLGTDTVVIKHPAVTLDAGAFVPDWSIPPASTDTVEGCSWQPEPGSDDDQHREGQQTKGTLYLPGAPPVGPLDHVHVPSVDGDLRVVGVPEVWAGVLIPHTVLRLERWDG